MSLPMSLNSSTEKYNPKELEKMEGPLIALAQASGGDLRKLFFAFFNFLYRRTDFYLVPPNDATTATTTTSNMGFREGDAEKLLLASFRQFPLRRIPSQQQQQRQQQQKQQQPKEREGPDRTSNTTTDQEVQKEDTTTKTKGGSNDTNSIAPAVATASAATSSSSSTTKTTTIKAATTTTDKVTKKSVEEDNYTLRYTEEGKQIPVGNGGSTKQYKWTQTIDECTVLLPVPEGTRGKDLDVTIKASSISVRDKRKSSTTSTTDPAATTTTTAIDSSEGQYLLNGELFEKIQPDESTWSLESNVMILILYKVKKTYWESIVKNVTDLKEKIDTSLVDSRRNIAEYDDDTQAMIRRIIFDQNQKRQGKPTSDQIMGKPGVPHLPPGVEYYDQSTIDQLKKEDKEKKEKDKDKDNE